MSFREMYYSQMEEHKMTLDHTTQQLKSKQSDFKMGKRSEQTFSQRHTDCQQVHKKGLNITNIQKSANQNHNEILLPHNWQYGYGQNDEKQQVLAWILVGM